MNDINRICDDRKRMKEMYEDKKDWVQGDFNGIFSLTLNSRECLSCVDFLPMDGKWSTRVSWAEHREKSKWLKSMKVFVTARETDDFNDFFPPISCSVDNSFLSKRFFAYNILSLPLSLSSFRCLSTLSLTLVVIPFETIIAGEESSISCRT